jgi:hypothetical protein
MSGARVARHRVEPPSPARRGIGDPARRISEARSMAALVAEAMADQPGLAAVLACEFRDVADRHEFQVLHDDLAVVNHPVLLREIVAEADAHGLAWLADADVYRHPAPAYGEKMNAWLATADRLTREHVIDHLRLRRYRESLFVHRAKGLGTPLAGERLANMHVGASNTTAERHGSAPRSQADGDRTSAGSSACCSDGSPRFIRRASRCRKSSWITSHSSAGSTLAAPAMRCACC